MSETSTLYMIKKYVWNGVNADEYDIFPTLDSSLALMKMAVIHNDDPDLEWATGEDGDLIGRGPGQYDYVKYYIDEMTLDKEVF